MHSSYSEADTSSIESTPCESFHLTQSIKDNISTGGSDYYSPLGNSSYNSPSIIEDSEPKINQYMTSSVSMRSVSNNIANESISRRPSSLPVFKQNGKF